MKQKDLLLISLTIFLTIVAWMIIDIYKIETKPIQETGMETMQLVDFQIDTKILQVLKGKIQ